MWFRQNEQEEFYLVGDIFEKYKEFDAHFENDLYDAIDLTNCVNMRISAGGTGIESVKTQISQVKEFLANEKGIH